mmetsp:Transcript_24169/g.56266  ORF Transcript_24169/g.56266 Transcript_24169/m.56266 type:complete len:97 (+) Transcript_24169:109-399(+)
MAASAPDQAATAPPPNAQSEVQLWEVVATSCLLRKGAGLKTEEVGRLRKGSIVKQEEQQGARLRVITVGAEQQMEGWVSTMANGKDVLRRVASSGS